MNPPCARAALLLLACLANTALQAQEPEVAPPEPDPAVEAAVTELADAWKDRRMERDTEATRLILQLSDRLDQPVHDDDRKAILVALTKVLTTGKLREPDAIDPYRRAAEGLGKLGDDGADVLLKVYEKKRFPRHTEWAPMRAILVDAIGRTGARAAIPFLCERLQRSGDDQELRAAGDAAGRFRAADQKDRKEFVRQLAQRLAGFEAQAAAPAVTQDQQLNLDRESAIRALRVVQDPFKRAMHALTGETFADGAAWQAWYQDNKRKDWPELSGDG